MENKLKKENPFRELRVAFCDEKNNKAVFGKIKEVKVKNKFIAYIVDGDDGKQYEVDYYNVVFLDEEKLRKRQKEIKKFKQNILN